MTYAQAKNKETCATPGCWEPAEVEITHPWHKAAQKGRQTEDREGIAVLGYCLTHYDEIPKLPDC